MFADVRDHSKTAESEIVVPVERRRMWSPSGFVWRGQCDPYQARSHHRFTDQQGLKAEKRGGGGGGGGESNVHQISIFEIAESSPTRLEMLSDRVQKFLETSKQKATCIFGLFCAWDIILPNALAYFCSYVAIRLASHDIDVLRSDFLVLDGGEQISDGDTLGMEGHEVAGIVLGFVVGLICTNAAGRYSRAHSLVRKLTNLLTNVADDVFSHLSADDGMREARVHCEFARLFHVLFFFLAGNCRRRL